MDSAKSESRSAPESAPKKGRRQLPVLAPEEIIYDAQGTAREHKSSLGKDGRRKKPQPADVSGRFNTIQRVTFTTMLVVLAVLPFIRVGGKPALLLDIPARQFTVLTASFGPQDSYLAFFVLTAGAFLLALSTSLYGRAFCGFACPQTVFLDGLYRPIERLFEGGREARIRLDRAPMGLEKALRKGGKHAAFLIASTVLAHSLVFLFVPIERSLSMMSAGPAAEPVVFAWVLALTGLAYFNFGFFREQFCLALCPYGRLQAALVDDDARVISYDVNRGEPRGKVGTTKGDCVDCGRCVVVCPTGIDIRNGLQLDCVACTACIDACDQVMDKLHRPRGLVRFEAGRALKGEKRRFWRPRLTVYVVLGLMGVVASTLAFSSRREVQVSVLRKKGPPYVLEGATARNTFVVHFVNKTSDAKELTLCATKTPEGMETTLPVTTSLGPREARESIAVFTGIAGRGNAHMELTVYAGAECAGEPIEIVKTEFIGP
jgi:cytochrome c oxidase accessory protein FixG